MMEIGKLLLIAGVVLCAVGGLLWLAGQWNLPFGRLPGDIRVEKPGFKFYFPIATCLLLSALVTLVVWLLRKR
jgi:hypothetical protein